MAPDTQHADSTLAEKVFAVVPPGSGPPPPPPNPSSDLDLKALLLGNWISALVVIGCLVMSAMMVGQLYLQLSDLNSAPATTAVTTLTDQRYLNLDTASREQVGLFALENDAQFLRTRRAQSLVAAKLYVQAISVLAGIALMVMGSSFVFARIKTDEPNHAGGEHANTKLALDTYSPGLVLAAFGSALIALAVFVSPNQTTTTQDAPVFLGRSLAAPAEKADPAKIAAVAEEVKKELSK